MSEKRDELLDHEADGIRELDNALPRWWLYGFYFTIVFGVVYVLNYHVIPTPLFGKATLTAEYDAEMAAVAASRPVVAATGVLVVRTDSASLERGNQIFHGQANACNACHRDDLGGIIGPNLTDDVWLHGCSPADLAKSISAGYPEKGMLPYGTTTRLNEDDLTNLVSYVLSKRGSAPTSPKTPEPDRDVACLPSN